MLRILVVGLLILVVVLMIVGRQRAPTVAPELATVLPEARPLPPTRFTATGGEPFTIEDFGGNETLLFFGFTNCPDVCPLTLQVLAQVKDEIESRAPDAVPRVAFVSVDPGRDSPATIRRYLDAFDSDFVGLSADEAEMLPLWQALGVTVHKQQVDGETYNVVHNGTIYVLDSSGRWIALFSGNEHDAAAVAEDYLRIRRRPPERTASTAAPGLAGLGGA